MSSDKSKEKLAGYQWDGTELHMKLPGSHHVAGDKEKVELKSETMDATADLAAALVQAEKQTNIPAGTPVVRGYDFNQGMDYDMLFKAYASMGLQASNLAAAIEEVNRMLRWRLSDEPKKEDEDDTDMDGNPIDRSQVRCTIFLGYTSNMISCGIREVIRYLVQHKMVDAIVTTAGGIEEDFMKCFHPTYMGTGHEKGAVLRHKGLNRIGNMVVPSINYCAFEDWLNPILDAMLKEQEKMLADCYRKEQEERAKGDKDYKELRTFWTPSRMIRRFGKEINHEDSVYYWAYKNDIPVFCPALTDGSLGDIIYFHSINNPGLVVDIAADISIINDIAVAAKKSGQLILGGGVVKHHICNANLMRNGADFSVYINTGNEFDGSDSGAHPDEAVSWGKIKVEAKPVKVYADASLVFPLLVSQTFVKEVEARKKCVQ